MTFLNKRDCQCIFFFEIVNVNYSVSTETGGTQTMKTDHMAELNKRFQHCNLQKLMSVFFK